jgi:excisionase family DNA binding protein
MEYPKQAGTDKRLTTIGQEPDQSHNVFSAEVRVAGSQPGAVRTLEWLTAAEAAVHLKVKVRTLLGWVRQGKIKGYPVSGTRRRVWRFLRSDLDAALVAKPVLTCSLPSVLKERKVA